MGLSFGLSLKEPVHTSTAVQRSGTSAVFTTQSWLYRGPRKGSEKTTLKEISLGWQLSLTTLLGLLTYKPPFVGRHTYQNLFISMKVGVESVHLGRFLSMEDLICWVCLVKHVIVDKFFMCYFVGFIMVGCSLGSTEYIWFVNIHTTWRLSSYIAILWK